MDALTDLEAEQAYIDRAYESMAAMHARVARLQVRWRNDYERDVFEVWQEERLASLSDTRSALVFGRLDRDDERWYIGRRHVEEPGGDTVVVDWRAPVAEAFYRARPAEPMGLRRRRHFLLDGRRLLSYSDDVFDDAARAEAGADDADRLRGAEVLRHELERRRTGEMRDIVATIQVEQDVVIRAPLEGVLVVQGGPGSGKTAIGLHRASYLLYAHRERLTRRGVLVVGPNRTFMRYIAQVLPSLGETAVRQLPVTGLGPLVPLVPATDVDAERRKGEAAMADAIAAHVRSRIRPLDDDVALSLHGVHFALPAAAASAAAETLVRRGFSHNPARDVLRQDLLKLAFDAYRDTRGGDLPWEDVVSAVRTMPAFRKAIDRMWPSLTPQAIVRKVAPRKGAHWTPADLALLDEANAILNGSPDKVGHLVVDEAQDLSPMQLRMLGRRCPTGSMTVLGDLAQATGPWAHQTWDEVLEHLPCPDGASVSELTLGYRVSAGIMEVAARLLPVAAPHVRAPVAVLTETRPPDVVRADDPARAAADATVGVGDEPGSIAVIAPDSLYEAVKDALVAAAVDFAEAEHGLDHRVTLVRVAECKGLEFDMTVLVEPAAVVEESMAGLRMLYVAMTRAMRHLVMVHRADLPALLVG